MSDTSVSESFGRVLAQQWARDGIKADEPAVLAAKVAALFAAGDHEARTASDLLIHTGVRAQWNDILRCDRSAALAKRIQPLVRGAMLDVLTGDGSVCQALSKLGVTRLAATERPGDYPETVLPEDVDFRSFTTDVDLTQFNASTALLSAVLHHEQDPVSLLEMLARSNVSRWIIIENCVTQEFNSDFHQFADLFFNNCLNDFGVHCGNQHRTLNAWTEMLARYGDVRVVESSFVAPGIPFPYSLLLVTTRC